MTLKIGIISGKGGVGKTFTAINLAAALNYFKKDVVLVDANLTTPNVSLHLGVPIVKTALHDVLKGRKHITEAVYQHESGIKIIPSNISVKSLQGINPSRLRKVLPALDGLTDFLIIDGAAGLGRETLATIEASDTLIIVTNPEITAVTDALKTIKISESLGKHVLGIVITRHGNEYDLTSRNISILLEKPIIGIIPEDSKIRESLIKKNALVNLFPKSKTAIAYKKLASDLINEKYFEEPEEGFLNRILNFFKR